MRCDGPEDCPNNQTCCGQWTGSGYSAVECSLFCTGVEFCDPNGPDVCGFNEDCLLSGYVDGYYVCR